MSYHYFKNTKKELFVKIKFLLIINFVMVRATGLEPARYKH